MKSNKKIIDGTLVYKQFIVLEDGTELQVRPKQDISKYSDYVTIYAYGAKKGKGETAEEVTCYAVAVEDAIRAERKSSKQAISDKVSAMQAQGLTPEQILAQLLQ